MFSTKCLLKILFAHISFILENYIEEETNWVVQLNDEAKYLKL